MRTETVHRQRIMVRIMTKDRQTSHHLFVDTIHQIAVDASSALDLSAIENAFARLIEANSIDNDGKSLSEIMRQLCETAVSSHNQINACREIGQCLYQFKIRPSVEEQVPAGDNDNTSERLIARG